MRARTIDPAIVRRWMESFFHNIPDFGRRILFDDLHGCGSYPLEAHFQSKEQPKVWKRHQENTVVG
jgi:hypothetical protein